MIPQNTEDFKRKLATTGLPELVRTLVFSNVVHVFSSEQEYEEFRDRVRAHLPQAERVAVVGSGNWRYSLNPTKLLCEFHKGSDIDVAVVSEPLYFRTWNEIRRSHRAHWYDLDPTSQGRLVRRGQDVYCGFASPAWIPERPNNLVYKFKTLLNRLSDHSVGYREVKMLYFRNETELLDYYLRGFVSAKKALKL